MINKLKLNDFSLKEDINMWLNSGYEIPSFDKENIIQNTYDNPFWIHFGAGNIFRAYQAKIMQNILNNQEFNKGIIVAEGYDYEIIDDIYKKYDNNSILVTLKSDGTINKKIINSITEALKFDFGDPKTLQRFNNIFTSKSLQIVSFTITEKGYNIKNSSGKYCPDIEKDFIIGPSNPSSFIAKLTSMLYYRFKYGNLPIALVSMDNCSHNGDKLKNAVLTIAKKWQINGLVKQDFVDYLNNDSIVSFPWTMIDKITPRPDEKILDILKKDNIIEMDPVITKKGTYIAPFVNAEETEYLIVEDNFPNGRPKILDKYITFTDRITVDKVEKMKVCTCLNPIHTTLAIFGCLLGFTKINDEMKDLELNKLAKKIGYDEGLKVVVDPIIINPKDFLDTVVNVRLVNPFLPDTPQRIATDTSSKLAIRFGETIKKYINNNEDDKLTYIPLVIAGWFRYLMAIDDNGNPFTLSDDPMMDVLVESIKQIEFSNNDNIEDILKPILSNESIFGLNLTTTSLYPKVITYFKEFNSGINCVRNTLKKYL